MKRASESSVNSNSELHKKSRQVLPSIIDDASTSILLGASTQPSKKKYSQEKYKSSDNSSSENLSVQRLVSVLTQIDEGSRRHVQRGAVADVDFRFLPPAVDLVSSNLG
jgi:hypothetical protein